MGLKIVPSTILRLGGHGGMRIFWPSDPYPGIVPAQSFEEKIVNGDMSSATGWTLGGAWTIGGGVATCVNGTGSSIRQNVLTIGQRYEISEDVIVTSGNLLVQAGSITNIRTIATTGLYREIARAAGADTQMYWNTTGAFNGVVDNASTKLITINPQQTAVSANMRISQNYTLPASPRIGDQIQLFSRISDFANGNYWMALLIYTGTQWDVTLYSVAAFVRTASAAAATNIGSTIGMRVNMNGNSIMLETTANGSTWTQRGTTVTDATYNTATGYNIIGGSAFTLGLLKFDPAT